MASPAPGGLFLQVMQQAVNLIRAVEKAPGSPTTPSRLPLLGGKGQWPFFGPVCHLVVRYTKGILHT